jgi:hypothetical protein
VARPTDPASADDPADDYDEEALVWAGDEEQGRLRPRLAERDEDASSLETADDDGTDDGDAEPAPARDVVGTAAAFLFGVLYLALTVGWIYSVQITAAPSTDLFPEIVWQFGEFTAMVAAPIWFAGVVSLTRGRIGLRLGWFALGLGLLLPWPILLELAG